MLATVQLNYSNQEEIVYTCPLGKKAFIYVDLCPKQYYPANTVKVYINNIQYGFFYLDKHVSIRLTLDEGDQIKVEATYIEQDSFVNIFVYGLETTP